MNKRGNLIKRPYAEIWYWYQHIEKFKEHGKSKAAYCCEHNLDLKKFNNLYYRIAYIRDTSPIYESICDLAREFRESTEGIKKFSENNNISASNLKAALTHVNYLDIIKRLKESNYTLPDNYQNSIECSKKSKKTPMSFIKVPKSKDKKPEPLIPIVQEYKVIEQNDLEIIITKGVKVSISPNIDSMKIIKIIELLKDL